MRESKPRPEQSGILQIQRSSNSLPIASHGTVSRSEPPSCGYVCSKGSKRRTYAMSDLPVETTPGVAAPAHEAARGQIVYITEHGERLAAIVPAAVAAGRGGLSPPDPPGVVSSF